MQVTYGELFSYQKSISKLMALEVPANVGIRIARLARTILDDLKLALDQRNKLIDKYGEKFEGTMRVLETSKKWGAFIGEFNALCAEKTTIDVNKIKIPADTKISVDVLLALDKFIEVEGE